MNIIYHGNNNNNEVSKILTKYDISVEGIEYNKKFNIIDRVDLLILNLNNYKRKLENIMRDKMKNCIENNFNKYKKYIFILNINKTHSIQSFIKNNYKKLSDRNRIIIITERLQYIDDTLVNSFHKIRIETEYKIFKYEPLSMLVNEVYDIYNNDMDPLTHEKVLNIKRISYNICKYCIPIRKFMRELMSKFIEDPKYTNKIKSSIIKFLADADKNMINSYRILIHVENMLIGIYEILITTYQ